MPQTMFGYKGLLKKLTCLQLMLIRPNMQDVMCEIRDKLAESEKQLLEQNEERKDTAQEKIAILREIKE